MFAIILIYKNIKKFVMNLLLKFFNNWLILIITVSYCIILNYKQILHLLI